MRRPELPVPSTMRTATTETTTATRARNGRRRMKCGSGSEGMLATMEAGTTEATAIAPAAKRSDQITRPPTAINDAGRFVITRPAGTAVRDDTSGQQDCTKRERSANDP